MGSGASFDLAVIVWLSRRERRHLVAEWMHLPATVFSSHQAGVMAGGAAFPRKGSKGSVDARLVSKVTE